MIHDTIKQRLRASLLVSSSGKNALDVAAQLAGDLTAEGTWKDLEAADQLAGKHGHLSRVMLLAKARHLAPGELDDSTRLAFDWWLSRDLRGASWYHDQIAVPRLVGEIALLFEEVLSIGAWGKVIEMLTRSRWSEWTPGVGWKDLNGATVLGVAYNVILRGCLENSPALCEGAFRRAFRNVRWVPAAEQDDTAFHESPGWLPTSDAGVILSRNYARLMALAHGTPWQAPAEATKALVNYLLDFQQWTMWRGLVNADACRSQVSEDLGETVAQLSQLGNPPRRDELADLADRLLGKGKPLAGHRHFWKSQLTVHQRPAFFSSLSQNGTSLPVSFPTAHRGRILGGNAVFLRTGQEYSGLTEHPFDPPSSSASAATLYTDRSDHANPWNSDRYRTAGGLGEGEYGMAGTDLNERGLRGKKAWFFFDDSVVCLEAGVHGVPSSEPVFTFINRCRLDGPVVATGNEGHHRRTLLPAQRHELTGVHRVEHGGFLYYFPGTTRVTADLRYSDDGVRYDTNEGNALFTLSVDHGTHPQGTSSACLVLPVNDEPASRLRAEREISEIEILANHAALQAVRHRGLGVVGIAFWEPGVLTLPGGGRVAANSRCLLLCRDHFPGAPTLHITNLLRHPVAVHVEYGGRCLCFELPGGSDAGRGFRRQM